jgi:hypothetical protein
MSILFLHAKPCQLPVRFFKIIIKLLACYQQAVSLRPIAIQEVFVGMRTEIVPIFS